jgi:transcriptional regulator with XRE-family HTH domain
MFPVVDRQKFGEWLSREREKRGWSQTELADRSGLRRQIISKTETGVSTPALETVVALADALEISPVVILRAMGLLPPGTSDQIRFEDWQFILDKLPEDQQEELYQIGALKVWRSRQAKEKAEAQRRRPVKSPK